LVPLYGIMGTRPREVWPNNRRGKNMRKKDALDIDNLTGVPGEKAFTDEIVAQIKMADDQNSMVSLAMVDIDRFKALNEEHGSEACDEIMKILARQLKDTLPNGALIYRYSKDEFTVLLPGIEKEEAFLMLEKARSKFDTEHEITVGGKRIKAKATVSTGIATYPDDGSKRQEIIRKAVDAQHRAKAGGKNKVAIAREERMVTKTSHYTHGQLERLSHLAVREGVGEAILLREALDNLLHKYSLG
jgi:diguanylate cyclase (GGDEF)-like protein